MSFNVLCFVIDYPGVLAARSGQSPERRGSSGSCGHDSASEGREAGDDRCADAPRSKERALAQPTGDRDGEVAAEEVITTNRHNINV